MKNTLIIIPSILGFVASLRTELNKTSVETMLASLCFLFIILITLIIVVMEQKKDVIRLSYDNKQQIQFFLIGCLSALFIVAVGFLIGAYGN